MSHDRRPSASAPAARPIEPAELSLRDGVPYSTRFSDVYHSSDGGFAQARAVFLAGSGLPARWSGTDRFVVLETGFGLGLNFIATWAAWLDDPDRPSRLHYVAVERHPFRRDDLRALWMRYPACEGLAAELLEAWPPLLRGFHRIELQQGRVVLTLLFDDAATALPEVDATADAVYLDGFAPSRNPDLWSGEVIAQVARLARPGATVATWTVAGAVRARLQAAGFAVERRAGFGRKREMLVGQRTGSAMVAAGARSQRVVVVGAGIAGVTVAERFAARGCEVTLLERHATLASEASGNPAGVLRPLLNRADNANARLSRFACLYAMRRVLRFAASDGVWLRAGVPHVARDPDDATRLRALLADAAWPDDFVRWMAHDDIATRVGHAVNGPGWWFDAAGCVVPGELCRAFLAAGSDRVTMRLGASVARIDRTGPGWRLTDASGAILATGDLVVLAAGAGCAALAAAPDQASAQSGLVLARTRGQVTVFTARPGAALAGAVCGNGYVAPMPDGRHCVGATFQHDDEFLDVRPDDHRENLVRLQTMTPALAAGVDAAACTGRAALRVYAPDRLPVYGARDAGGTGPLLATGLGARGLVWAPLCAELIAAQACGDPLPLPRDLADAISPRRFDGRCGTGAT
jgi:tRNA 5-methylaminomethyl-2-thiouridine biosynthesis bifunctional protein